MKSEIYLYIIWKNAEKYKDKIITDIKKNFDILKVLNVKWSNKNFSKNLTRFYGTFLPFWSGKQRDVGTGNFTLVIVKDSNPIYDYRNTLHGKDFVNIKMFDSKIKYRKLVGGGSRIHCSNSLEETNHDLTLLLGYNVEDFLKNIDKFKENFKGDLIGTNGWKSMNEYFYVLNNTINYVVLRNYEYLPNQYISKEHGDIDLLTDNKDNLISISNAKKVFKGKNRVHYAVLINKENVYFDFRYVGDDYYTKEWEKDILLTKKLKNKIYINSGDNFKYSLLYHALIQKRKIANDYKERLTLLFDNKKDLFNELDEFMKKHNYSYTICKDKTVYFNEKYVKVKKSLLKKIYEFVHYELKEKIRKILK